VSMKTKDLIVMDHHVVFIVESRIFDNITV